MLDAIKASTYGPNFIQRSLPQCVFEGSLRQARCAENLCIAALVDAVTAQNCFSIFVLAASCGCAALQASAEACALREFPAAALEDHAGLTALSEQQLTHFLCSDTLMVRAIVQGVVDSYGKPGGDRHLTRFERNSGAQVDFELAVFKALSDWVEADLRNRLGRFASLLARCVRFGQLSLADLTLLVDHSTLVALDREAMSLAAHAIIQYYMGTKFDSPCAEIAYSTPRACQRAAAAAGALQATSLAPEQPGCGMADHAHRSVFEAVLCCTHERRRWAPAPPLQLDLTAASLRRLSVESDKGEEPMLAMGTADSAASVPPSSLEGQPCVCKAPAGLAVEMQLSPTRMHPAAPGKRSHSPPSMPPSAPTRRSLRW